MNKDYVWLTFYNGKTTFCEVDDDFVDDWGVEGPTFGPYEHVQITYSCHIKAYRPDGNMDDWTAEAFGDEEDDPHEFGGTYHIGNLHYGDITIHNMPELTPVNYPQEKA